MQTALKHPSSSLLLAAASAGLLTQSASAAFFYDDTTSDLSNVSTTPTPVSFNTFVGVTGQLTESPFDRVDALSLTNLPAGSILDVSADWTDNGADGSFRVRFFDSSDVALVGVSDIGPSAVSDLDNRSMTVPGDGVVRIVTDHVNAETGGWTYGLEFDVTAVPEPATKAAGAAIALAALLELRRRRQAK